MDLAANILHASTQVKTSMNHLYCSNSAGLKVFSSLHELKEQCCQTVQGPSSQNYYSCEKAKLLRAEGQHDLAVRSGRYITQNYLRGRRSRMYTGWSANGCLKLDLATQEL